MKRPPFIDTMTTYRKDENNSIMKPDECTTTRKFGPQAYISYMLLLEVGLTFERRGVCSGCKVENSFSNQYSIKVF